MAQPSPVIHRPRPASSSEYLKFSLWFILLTGLGSAGFVLLLWHRQPWGLVLFAVGVAGAVFVAWSARAFHQQAEYAMNPTITLTEPAPPPVLQTAYANIRETPAGRETRFGDYHMEESERARLSAWILRQGGVSRDGLVVLGIRGLPDMKKPTAFAKTGYEELLTRWGRGGLGWLDGSRLTEEGRAHFIQFAQQKQTPPEHSPTPPLVYQVASAHEATGDATTKKR